jgi:hypothetical protein
MEKNNNSEHNIGPATFPSLGGAPSPSPYDAPGSEKTYALVKEYLKIILTAHKTMPTIFLPLHYQAVLHEMSVGSLSEFAKDEPSQADLMQDLSTDTGLSIIEIKTKSQQIIKHIIHNYAAFDISTIDKFTHKDVLLPMILIYP